MSRNQRRPRFIRSATVLVGLVSLGILGATGHDWAWERWYLRQLEVGDASRRDAAAEWLARRHSAAALPLLLRKSSPRTLDDV